MNDDLTIEIEVPWNRHDEVQSRRLDKQSATAINEIEQKDLKFYAKSNSTWDIQPY